MKTAALGLAASLAFSAPALAQTVPAATDSGNTTPVSQAVQTPAQPERRGFTLLLNLGFGVQQDGGMQDSATGLAGLNLGIGGFLTKDLALMFRISGTNVNYDFFNQVSGVGGVTLQFWPSDRFNIEGGAGFGFWNAEGDGQRGFGLILAGNVVVFHRGKHYLQVGAEYAPAFTDWGTIQNVGFTFGYQFHR